VKRDARKPRFRPIVRAGLVLGTLAFSGAAAVQELPMQHQITGTFDVKISAQSDGGGAAAIARMVLDKQFHGVLDAHSDGQMLAYSTETPGSAGYVAIEKVTGTLEGRSGSFALQHSGIMNRGQPQLSLQVIPDSGTGELSGLSGTMNIRIEDGQHHYDFGYSLP